MNRVMLVFIVAASLAIPFPHGLHAQEAEAPAYKEGDWWRVKVEVARPVGVSVGGPQLGGFPEYLVRVENSKFRVFGIREDQPKEIDSATIVSLILGKPEWRGDLLKFPMRVGLSWSAQFPLQMPGIQRQELAQYEVQAWEKVKTLKGEIEAFKILMAVAERTGRVGRLPSKS